jgi:hypothetical protein
LFTNDAARSKFLAHLMTGTKEILQTGQGAVTFFFFLVVYGYVIVPCDYSNTMHMHFFCFGFGFYAV